MSAFTTFPTRSAHRKGGPHMVFGRPVTDIQQPSRSAATAPRATAAAKPPTAPAGTGCSENAAPWGGLVLSPTTAKAEQTRVRAMKQEAFNWVHRRDRDHLKLQEFKLAKSKLRAAAYSTHGVDYKELFHYYDRDNTGALDLEEFLSALRRDAKQSRSKRGWSDKTIVKMFRMIDTDDSGSIEYEEFRKWLSEDNAHAFLRLGDESSSSSNGGGGGGASSSPVGGGRGGKNNASPSSPRQSPIPDHPRLSTAYILSRRVKKQQQQLRFEQLRQEGVLERQRDELVAQWRKAQHNRARRVIDSGKVVDRLYPFRSTQDMKHKVSREMARRHGYGAKGWGRKKQGWKNSI
jgi:Ca2+-binding EF-hand superfamily protein